MPSSPSRRSTSASGGVVSGHDRLEGLARAAGLRAQLAQPREQTRARRRDSGRCRSSRRRASRRGAARARRRRRSQIGTGARGAGLIWRRAEIEEAAVVLDHLAASRALRSTSIISSKRLPRVAKSTPSASYSSRIQPAPQPSTTRPPDSTRSGSDRLGDLERMPQRQDVDERAEVEPRRDGRHRGDRGPRIGERRRAVEASACRPREYGYFERSSPGKKRWSESSTPWKPASSAPRAMSSELLGLGERERPARTSCGSPLGYAG